MGVALPAVPRLRARRRTRARAAGHPDFRNLWDAVSRIQVPRAARPRHARAVGGRRRRRGRAAASAARTRRSSTSRRPATASRATRPSSSRRVDREVRLRLTPLRVQLAVRSRKPTIASLKRSFRSPATMWPAPATSTYSGVRHQLEQVLRALLAQQVAHAAAHEQRGDGDVARRVLQPALVTTQRRARLVARPELARHEPRVPVPDPAAVVALAHVLLQAGRGRSGAAGAGCTRRSRRRPRRATRSPSSMCSLMNAPMRIAPVLLDRRRDVDEHEAAGDRLVGLADRDDRRDAHRATRRRAPGGYGSAARRSRDVAGEGLGARSRRRRASRSRRGRAGRRGRRAARARRAPAPSALPHANRVCPPPCSSTTGGTVGSPNSSASGSWRGEGSSPRDGRRWTIRRLHRTYR